MPALCLGGVCIPYTALIPAVFLALRWLATHLARWGILPDSVARSLGTAAKQDGSAACCGTSPPDSRPKPRRSKIGKSASTLSASSTGGTDGTVLEIESVEEFRGTVDGSGRCVVAKFTADWCKPCKAIDPFYRDLALKYDATFVKVDVDELDEVAADCSVAMMPTFVVFRNGAQAGKVSGAHEENLERLIREHCPARVRT